MDTIRLTCALIYLLFSTEYLCANIKHTEKFNPFELAIGTTKNDDGKIFTNLHYGDFASIPFDNGIPKLPIKYIRLSVPCYASDFTVKATPRNISKQILEYQICPVQQEEEATEGESCFKFIPPKGEIYNNDATYPNSYAEFVSEGYLDGDKHIVTIAIFPIAYNPVQNEIYIPEYIDIELEFKDDNSSTFRPIIRVRNTASKDALEYTKTIVSNPSQVEAFSPSKTSNPIATTKPMSITALPAYEYCVITSRKLCPAFKRLIEWKRQKGYSAGIVCIEDILSCPDFAKGDEVSNINDDAGKLRAYLRYTYEGDGSGKYVLLGGDYSVVPIRYGHKANGGEPINSQDYYAIPSDSYFSDLNGNWNVDNDEFFGEPDDHVDFNPELFVGRLLCQTEEEANNYITKLLTYERDPGHGDFSYLSKAFYTQCDQMLDGKQADIFASIMESSFPNKTIFSETPSSYSLNPTFPTGTDCISEMNKHYGLFSWHGHGNPGGVGVMTKGINTHPQYGILAHRNETSFHESETGNGLDNLTNFNYPAIAISPSCQLAPFDIYKDYDLKHNVGSSFTVGGAYGGVAFIGNSRSVPVFSGFDLEKYVGELLNRSISIGACVGLAKDKCYDHRTKLAQNLIGCPEFKMWTREPSFFKDVIYTINDGITTISSNDLTGANIAIHSGKDYAPHIIESENSTISIAANTNFPVMLYKDNYIPYILPLVLQNSSYSGINHLFVNDVKIGKDVDNNRNFGIFKFMENSETTFEADGSVEILTGTEFLPTSTVTIISKNKVFFSGCIIHSGAKIYIKAPELVLDNNVTIEKGSTFEFIQKNKIL